MFNQLPKFLFAGKPVSFLLVTFLLLTSCASKKDILLLQDIETIAFQTDEMYSNPVIRPNDILIITVSAADMDAVMPFNLMMPARNIREASNELLRELQGYIVSSDGTIEFPTLGSLKVGGMTRQELLLKLKEDLTEYVKDPVVNIRIANFKVTVIGEVARPGTYPVRDERITLLEAIGMAGDLTPYGRRDNIVVLREQDGLKQYKIIDIRNSDFLQSDYYYLQQNDVVWVQPNGPQVQASAFNRNIPVYVSITSVLISLAVLLMRL